MGPILMLLVLGLAIFAAIPLAVALISDRQRSEESTVEAVVPVNLVDSSDAVLVAEGRGRLVFANQKARAWFGMNGDEPNLEAIAQQAQPAASFLELFGKEGQASFRLGQRRVEASSHFIPSQDTQRKLVVVMRELSSAATTGTGRDSTRTMNVINEMAEIISGGLNLNETLDAILFNLNHVIAFDSGEITLWDENLRILRPLGRGGAHGSDYAAQFEATDGIYHLEDSLSGWLARYRQPLLVADISTRPDIRPKITTYPLVSYVGVPLQVADRLIGTLELASRERFAFDHEDMALLQATAAQTAMAIENAQLNQSQVERVAELSGLQQIAQTMGVFTDVRQMYGQLTARIAGLMNTEMCGVLLYDADQKALVSQLPFHNVLDALSSLYRIPLNEDGQATKIWLQRDWWYSNNVATDDLTRSLGLLNLADVLGIRSTAIVPMLVGTRRIGAVQVSNKRDRSGFSDDDMRLLAVFASQTAIVVENARLYAEEQRRAEELGGLQQISLALGVLHDASELYGQISDRVAKLMNVQICGVLMLDTERHVLEAQAPFHGIRTDLIPYYELNVAPGTPLHALYHESDSWYVNDMFSDPIVGSAGLDRIGGLVAMRQTLLVPLIAGDRRLGAIQVANRVDGRDFSEEDARILGMFAAQAAVLIDNARLYREMQTRAQASEGLRKIAEIASSNLAIAEIVKQVNREISALFNCQSVLVAQIDERIGRLVLRPDYAFGVRTFTEALQIDIYATGMEHSTVISKRPFVSTNIRTDGQVLPTYRAIAERIGLDNVIQVPLLSREQAIGELTIGNKREGEFNQADVRLLQSVAVQIATALERSTLYQATDADLRARVQELDALSRVSTELNQTIQLERVLDVVRVEAQRNTNAKAAVVVQLEEPDQWPSPEQPVVVQRLGGQKVANDLTPIELRAVLENRVVLVTDYNESPLETTQAGVQSALAAPIQYGGQVLGVIHIYSDVAGAFDNRAVDFITALAKQSAIAFGNAARYRQQLERADQVKERTDQLAQIFELGRLLRTESNLETILEAVAHSVIDAVGFNGVLISVVDRPTRSLRRYAQAGIPIAIFEEMKKISPPLEQAESLFQVRYRISGSYLLPTEHKSDWNTPDLPITTVGAKQAASGPNAWRNEDVLLIPLRGGNGEMIGLMSVDEPRDGKRPTLRVIEALEIFANQAAFAIENYQLLQAYQFEGEATRRERDRLAQLHQVASEIQRAPDVPTRLQVVADGIYAAGWGRVNITLRDANLEPRELITAGYTPSDVAKLKEHLLPGIVWQQRLADPSFRSLRVGQAYYLRQSDPWVTENKLIAAGTPSAPLSNDPNAWQPQDTLYLPLYGLDQNRVIGIIAMDSPQDGRAPTESTMRPIELFASQAASAIENTRLYQETTRAAQQETRVNAVMEAVASTLDTTEIITAVAKGLQQLIAFTRMSVALLDRSETHFDVLDVRQDIRTNTVTVVPIEAIGLDNTVLGRVYYDATGRVYHQDDLASGAEYEDLQAWRASGERTSLVVPLIAGGRAVGVLHMGSELISAFGFDEQLPLVQRMANLTAVAIENARLFEQTIDRERFTSSLGRVGQSLNAIFELSSILTIVCAELVNFLETGVSSFASDSADMDAAQDVTGASITLVEGGELVGYAGYGSVADELNGIRVTQNDPNSVTATVFKSVQPLIVNDFGQQTQYHNPLPGGQPLSALIATPLTREMRSVGVLTVFSQNPTRQFTESDLERTSAFAAQASLALENARLNEQTRGLTAFNESIVQSIQQGIIVLDKDLRIRTINSYMIHTYGWDESAVGQALFEYRPNYVATLKDTLQEMLSGSKIEPLYNVRETNFQGKPVVRNFYIYPLLQASTVNGAVVLIEDVTERSQLEANIQERAQELTALTEISGQLTATLEPDAVVQLVINQLGRILTFDNVTLWLRQDEKLVIRAAQGYPDVETLIGVEVEIADSALFREIAARGQVLNIPDVHKDTRFPPDENRPTSSWMGISLISKGNLYGLLVLEKKEPAYYHPTQEQLGVAFANQAAVALENARLFQQRDLAALENTQLYQEARGRAAELNRQADRLALLNRVSSALAQSLDIENVFEVTISELVKALNMDRGEAMLLEVAQNRQRLVVEFPRGDAPPELYLPLDNNPLYDAIRKTMSPVSVYEVREDPITAAVRSFLIDRNVLSSIFIPLVVGGQLIGTIGIHSTEEYHAFTPDQNELAQTIASQAAVAVQNASLFEQSVVRTRELETLFEATQATSATLDLDEVILNTAMQMINALSADGCQIGLLDDVENRLEIRVDVQRRNNRDQISQPGTFLPLSEYPARLRAVNQRQIVAVHADDTVLDVAESGLLIGHGVFGRLMLPMIARDQVIGLIIVEVASKTRRFGSAEIRLARALSNQAAVAIDNARLQTETAFKLQELFVINELATALASSIEQEQIFRVFHDQMPLLTDAEIILLAIFDPDTKQVSYPVALRKGKDFAVEPYQLADDEISYVIKRRMPLLLAGDDVQEVLRIFGITLRVTQARSFLGVPLQTGESVVGVLALADEVSTRAFGLDNQRVLTTIGSQLAVSIQNSRLFARNRRFTSELETTVESRTEELRNERDRINFLYRITTGLTASLDMEQVLSQALEMMAAAVGAEMGAILGIDSISENLIYRATFGLSESDQERVVQFTQNEGLAGWVIQTQQSVIVADVQDDARWLHRTAIDNEPRAAIAALLEANEDILGVVMLYSRTPGKFNDDHLRLAVAASGQVATAMNNADLYGLIREQAERLGAMVRREQIDATKNAAIVESIADGVMVADPNGEIIQFNSAAERVLGLPRKHVLGHRIDELSGLYAAGGGRRWLDTLQSWMDDPTQHRPDDVIQEQLQLENGRAVRVVLSPVNMGDQFLGTVSVFRDVTREMEVDRMKTEFVATVSHELRTPMTSIKGYADLLMLGAAGEITEQQQRFLGTIKTNADRLSVLVNDLLDISRIDRGVVKLSLQPMSVEEVIGDSMAHLDGRIAGEHKDIETSTEIEPSLPLINGDYEKMTQIMNNLLDNAFNYTHAGGSVRVKAAIDGDAVLISVADTGVGIPLEKQARVFERFFRDEENQLVMETSGTGLGLAIVREYVNMHKGSIWLQSEPGRGTTFFIRVPAMGENSGRGDRSGTQKSAEVDGDLSGR